ncbi:MAG: hypothetical protein Q9204_007638, partial [Flavoplaca sp. TL-2023a]
EVVTKGVVHCGRWVVWQAKSGCLGSQQLTSGALFLLTAKALRKILRFTISNTMAHGDSHQHSVMEGAAHEDKTEAAVAMSCAPRTPTTSNPPSGP